jgi:hypothetical protein
VKAKERSRAGVVKVPFFYSGYMRNRARLLLLHLKLVAILWSIEATGAATYESTCWAVVGTAAVDSIVQRSFL